MELKSDGSLASGYTGRWEGLNKSCNVKTDVLLVLGVRR